MEEDKKTLWVAVALSCIVIMLTVFLIISLTKIESLKTQIKDYQALDMQYDLQTQELNKLKNYDPDLDTKTAEETVNLSAEQVVSDTYLLEFVTSYMKAQDEYIETLQDVLVANDIMYPIFIYAEIKEEVLQ